MHMNVMFFKKIRRNGIFFTYRTDITDPRPGRFFHHISELPRKHKFSFSRHYIDFDLKRIASDACPCKSPDNSYFRSDICHLISILLFSEKTMDISVCHCNFFSFCRKDFFCSLSAHISDLSFKLAHSGFFRIISCYLPD